MRLRDWVILSGNANPSLAKKICEKLGKPMGKAEVKRFKDGEIFVEIKENIRGKDCYVIQSTSRPVNDNLMELLIMIDAMKRASAKEITAVIPYYGYARQDRKVAPRTPITAKLVADLVATAGATRIVSMDLHAGQIQGFFDVPFDHLFASPVVIQYIKDNYPQLIPELTVVSPDAGGMERARFYAKHLDCGVAMIDKRRIAHNVAKAYHVVGDVSGKIALIVDDMIDTAGTLTEAANALLANGAKQVYAACTHPVFSGPAVERITSSSIEKVICTDTLDLTPEMVACPKIEQLTAANLLAEAIHRIHNYDSVSSLFL
tara:strand:+ start:3157 stop:4110 length:954 start_codon:yes stop_codon:yes gene_type:complete